MREFWQGVDRKYLTLCNSAGGPLLDLQNSTGAITDLANGMGAVVCEKANWLPKRFSLWDLYCFHKAEKAQAQFLTYLFCWNVGSPLSYPDHFCLDLKNKTHRPRNWPIKWAEALSEDAMASRTLWKELGPFGILPNTNRWSFQLTQFTQWLVSCWWICHLASCDAGPRNWIFDSIYIIVDFRSVPTIMTSFYDHLTDACITLAVFQAKEQITASSCQFVESALFCISLNGPEADLQTSDSLFLHRFNENSYI